MIPIQTIENRVANNDALVFLAGLKFGDFNLGYSYDVTVSELSRYNAASHELSLVYHFGSENVHCPDPWGTSKKRRSFRRRLTYDLIRIQRHFQHWQFCCPTSPLTAESWSSPESAGTFAVAKT